MIDRTEVINGLEREIKKIRKEPKRKMLGICMTVDEAEGIVAMLKEQEAVVRCKDCKYCVKEPNGKLFCDILAIGYEPFGSKKVTENWFCADGERR